MHLFTSANGVLLFLASKDEDYIDTAVIESMLDIEPWRGQIIYNLLKRNSYVEVVCNAKDDVVSVKLTKQGRLFIETSGGFELPVSELIKDQTQIDYKARLIFFQPTIKDVLYLIKRDKRTFNGEHYVELLKIFNSDRDKHKNIGEFIRVLLEAETRGYIKRSVFESSITGKGKWYSIVHHPTLPLWGIIVAILLAIPTWNLFNCNKEESKRKQANYKLSAPTIQKVAPSDTFHKIK